MAGMFHRHGRGGTGHPHHHRDLMGRLPDDDLHQAPPVGVGERLELTAQDRKNQTVGARPEAKGDFPPQAGLVEFALSRQGGL